jgi:glycerol-3-phosphate dehydrogenase
MDFTVVKKSLQERQLLIDAAPYRVWPLRFGVPVNQHSRIGSWRLKIGLSIYDFLAGIFHSWQIHASISSCLSCSDFLTTVKSMVSR